MKRWTNGLPGATKRLGAMMALRGLSVSQPRMRADTHVGPEHDAPIQRPNTLLQLSRSSISNAILLRAAGPYVMARPFRAGYRSGWSGNHGPAADGRAQATDAKLAAQPVRLRVGSLHAPTPHPDASYPRAGGKATTFEGRGGGKGVV